MADPWLGIPLADYEAHMAAPSVGQARMLADSFAAALSAHSPTSVAILGCAGGNGFERVAGTTVRRLVGIDINPRYLAQARRRYAGKVPGLELHCADLQRELPAIEPVELVFAALLFEYVRMPAALANTRTLCRPGGVLVALLQLPGETACMISPSPYASLQALGPVMRPIPPLELRHSAAGQGFAFASEAIIALASGKRFSVQTFRG
jgi:SAM-dependent methyltransferase